MSTTTPPSATTETTLAPTESSTYPSPQADFLVSTLLVADPLNSNLNSHLTEEDEKEIRQSYDYEPKVLPSNSVEPDSAFEAPSIKHLAATARPLTLFDSHKQPLTHFAQLLAFKKGKIKKKEMLLTG